VGRTARWDLAEGVVSSRASYLTADERDIYTDYHILIRHVLFQRRVFATARPGTVQPMIFKTYGGRVVINGVPITVDVRANNVRVALKDGDEVYVFARHDVSDGKWRFGPFDVFLVTGANVVTPGAFRDLDGSVPEGLFRRRIRDLQPAAAVLRSPGS
jgi:hypothetical protein